jgi:hypothetical protein
LEATSQKNSAAPQAVWQFKGSKSFSIKEIDWTGRTAVEVLARENHREIEWFHQGSIASFKIHHRDAQGFWGVAEWINERVKAIPMRGTDSRLGTWAAKNT